MASRSKSNLLSELGLVVPEVLKATQVNFRLAGPDAQKLDALAKEANVGRSKLARLIVEKFLADHERARKGKR